MSLSSLVSIVVPAYNASQTLCASIESLLSQSLKDIEIIIVNDASQDNTLMIAEALAKRDSRVKVFDLDVNQGVYKARALGIEKASSPWIGFLDADDFAKPIMYEKLYEVAEEFDTDIVVCEADRVTPERKKISTKVSFQKSHLLERDFFEAYCKQILGTDALWNKLYRARLVKKWATIEHPFRQDNHEDAIINFGCFYDAKSVYILKQCLYEYNQNPKSVTSKITNSDAFLSMIKAYLLTISLFSDLDEKSLEHIIEHYRIQLEWAVYTPESLNLDNEKLAEILPMLVTCAQKKPEAIIALILRKPNNRKRGLKARIRGFFS